MKVALLGLGSAGQRHGADLRELGHEVVAFDPDESRATPDGADRAATVDDVLRGAQAAVVATPNRLHAKQAQAALAAGVHVLVEKPLASGVDDGEALVRAAEAKPDLVCAVAMNLRFHAGVIQLKQLIVGGDLGPIRQAQASFGFDLRNWRPGTDYRESYSARADLGGGIVLDAIHELDYLTWLLGPAKSVIAMAGHVSDDLEIDVEDTALATLELERGGLAIIDLNFHEPAYRRGCLLVGAERTARWDWNAQTVVVSRHGEPDRTIPVPCEVRDTYRAEVADFMEAVTSGRAPRTSAAEGLAALRLAQRIKASSAEGRKLSLG